MNSTRSPLPRKKPAPKPAQLDTRPVRGVTSPKVKTTSSPTGKSSTSPTTPPARESALKTREPADESKDKGPPKHVSFNDAKLKSLVTVPRDQDNPVEIWNVYSHVTYATKREQRFLQRNLNSRIHECVDHCPNLFPDPPPKPEERASVSNRTAPKADGSVVEFLTERGYGKNLASCAMYIISVWPSFPIAQRPPLSSRVQMAMEALQAGTRLYVFNEKPNSPVKCGTALRMLHSIDADEASIAIFNPDEKAVIDGYIPLSFVVSLSFGLEPVEKERHLKKSGKILCADGERRFLETPKRAFTLHCAAPEKFYVTFIASNQRDFDSWTRVIDYFVLLNACCRTYIQTR